MRLWKGIAIGCTLSLPLWALIYWSDQAIWLSVTAAP